MKAKSISAISVKSLLLLAVSVGSGAEALAADALSIELATLARSTKKFLSLSGGDSIAIGDFRGPAGKKYGPRIVETLKAELEKVELKIARTGIGIGGKYIVSEIDDPNAERDSGLKVPIIKITAEFIDGSGNRLNTVPLQSIVWDEGMAPLQDGEFTLTLRDPASKEGYPDEGALIAAGAPGGQLRSNLKTPSERARAIGQLINSPDLMTSDDGSRLFAAGSKAYGVELLVNGARRPFTIEPDKTASVRLQLDETCEIGVLNQSGFDAAVAITIDGLSVFQFSELRHQDGPLKGEPLYAHFVVPPSQKGSLIRGWHLNNEKSAAFRITSPEQSAVAELGKESDSGVVTVTFAAAWDAGQAPPPGEPGLIRGDKRDGPKRMGRGDEFDFKIKEVQREVGKPRAVISFYYDRTAK
ncbi:hypothetical protein [Lacipirellula limnantheis]|uniref:Uncharacterized protein n=1 Tax=Lacipirellula limnantheis TaxID=2528024 RepID=A0A517TTP5_9BACT|nr:hypothetical protein [Lacipirellula limnantheis]QDT71732.1 hypothetical protein I41_08920 [Lacipirellula limnantheis]